MKLFGIYDGLFMTLSTFIAIDTINKTLFRREEKGLKLCAKNGLFLVLVLIAFR